MTSIIMRSPERKWYSLTTSGSSYPPSSLQIPYKLYLGSDKDIEDAVYLWMLFRETLDGDLLRSFMERLAGPGGALWN